MSPKAVARRAVAAGEDGPLERSGFNDDSVAGGVRLWVWCSGEPPDSSSQPARGAVVFPSAGAGTPVSLVRCGQLRAPAQLGMPCSERAGCCSVPEQKHFWEGLEGAELPAWEEEQGKAVQRDVGEMFFTGATNP